MRYEPRGDNTEAIDDTTDLRLLIEKTRIGYEFNGHVFATEDAAKSFVATYAEAAINRHGLSAEKKASR